MRIHLVARGGTLVLWLSLIAGSMLMGCSAEDDDDMSPAGDDDTDGSGGDDDTGDDDTGDDDTGDDDTIGGSGDDDSPAVESPTPSLDQVCGWDGLEASGPFQDWWQDGVFYEAFVRSYQDSDGDGHGDLQGLISRLDHLNDGDPSTDTDLGVTGLWLMPVFKSPSDHGYDVTDFRAINPDYGSLQDLQDLIDAAHVRGIKVILDLVFNHTASSHPWFTSAAGDTASPYRDWYVWSSEEGGNDWYLYGDAYYYAAFFSGMPDLNYYSAEVQAEMASIYDHWLELGIDGFRLDGVKYLVEQGTQQENTAGTHCYLQGQRRYFDANWPDRVIVGEVWDTVTAIDRYFGDGQNELPLAFDFPLSDGIIRSVGSQDPAQLHTALANREYYFPSSSMGAPFLRNHDMDRTGSVLAGPGPLKLAAAIQFSVPGTPFIYYGEELGMTGEREDGQNHDNARRSPMQWSDEAYAGFTCEACTPWYPVNADYPSLNVASQDLDPDSLLSWYRTLIRLRTGEQSLRRGAYRPVTVMTPGASGAYAYLRGEGDGAVLVVLNLKATALEGVTVDLTSVGSWTGGIDLLHGVAVTGPVSGLWSVGTLPPYGALWIKLEQPE